jgi:signal transduction histidine kinase
MSKRSIKILRIATIISVAIIIFQAILDWGKELSWEQRLEDWVIVLCVALFLTIINVFYEEYISARFSWEKAPRKRLVIGSIGSIVITVLAYGLARMILFTFYYKQSIDVFFENEKRSYYLFFVLIAVVISLVIHAFYFYRALQKQQVKEQKIIAGTASARFDALKNQLDPHFLFNSLNVLTSLIEEAPDQAQKFTTSLSKVYRYVLEQKNKDLVTVNEELDFARTYVRLLKMRFEDSIVFDIPEEASDTEAKIVPLSLQLLLENAVKHNVVTSSRPLHIKVFEKNGNLVVKNNLQEKPVVKKSSGVGLQNIQQRYHILSDRKVAIEKTTKDFSVSLPMLSKKITVLETQETHIEEKRYLKAKERVDAIKGFYGNLTSYLIVIPILWWLNFRTTDFLWAFFPTFGWGFGLTMHAMEAFGYNPLWGKRWQEKKIKELMEKDDF